VSNSSQRLISRLKLRHLTLLTSVGRLRSITRAADELGISQPAATKALAEVEHIFEAPLFIRSRQGLEPTPLGTLALVRAKRMMLDLEHWGEEMEVVRSGHAAQLRIGVIPFISQRIITPAVERLCEEGINVVIHRATTDQLLQELREHEIDCVMGRAAAAIGMADMWHQVLYKQHPALIAHPALAKRIARTRPDWRALAKIDWILPSSATPIGHMVTELFTREQVRPPVARVETYSTDVIAAMLSRNDNLLSIVPEDIAHDMAQRGGVACVEWEWDWELPPISLIRQVRDVPFPAEERFAQILHELTR
jgi:DNA-binding transcriptional LysR family regulator